MDKVVYFLTAYNGSERLPEVKQYKASSLFDLLTLLGIFPDYDTWYILKGVRKGIFRKRYDYRLVARSVGLEGK